jgi:hypothetical protein
VPPSFTFQQMPARTLISGKAFFWGTVGVLGVAFLLFKAFEPTPSGEDVLTAAGQATLHGIAPLSVSVGLFRPRFRKPAPRRSREYAQ